MSRIPRRVGLLVLLASGIACAQDAKQLVRQAVQTEMAANRADQSKWLFYEVDKKGAGSLTQWVAETSKGNLTRVLEQKGSPQSAEQQRKAMDAFMNNAGAQAKQRQADRHDDQQATALLKLLPDAFLWTDGGTEGGNTVLHFKPDPSYHAPSREARVFSAMEGDLLVETSQHRIASIKGHLIHDVTFGAGLLGRLKQGGSFDVERRETGHRVWQITATHVHVRGRALLFKSISEQEDDDKSKFESLPENISLPEAEKRLLSKPDQ